MTDFKKEWQECTRRLGLVTREKDRLQKRLNEVEKDAVKHNEKAIKILKQREGLKRIIEGYRERLKHQDQLVGDLVTFINKHISSEYWPKLKCLYCDGPIDFQKDHSLYHTACQKKAKSARSRAKSKQAETLQEDAIETIILMLKLLEGEPIDIHLAFSSIVEISKVLRSPDQDDAIYTLQPAEAEFLEAIRKYESDANPRKRA